MKTPMKYQFKRTGKYLYFVVVVEREGKVVEELKLFGPMREKNIERLVEQLTYAKAAKVVAFGQPVENDSWK